MKQVNILLGVTGSVAAIKTAKIVELLLALESPEIKIKVEIVQTEASRHFFKIEEYPELIQSGVKVWRDSNEWELWNKRNDPVLHIDLRKWADILLIAPLDANTLAKISTGLCDNLLTCVARAWDFNKPIFVAPAMNTFMWDHPITSSQIETIKSWGVGIIEPISKVLMCGDVGSGAMQEPEQIVSTILERIKTMK